MLQIMRARVVQLNEHFLIYIFICLFVIIELFTSASFLQQVCVCVGSFVRFFPSSNELVVSREKRTHTFRDYIEYTSSKRTPLIFCRYSYYFMFEEEKKFLWNALNVRV